MDRSSASASVAPARAPRHRRRHRWTQGRREPDRTPQAASPHHPETLAGRSRGWRSWGLRRQWWRAGGGRRARGALLRRSDAGGRRGPVPCFGSTSNQPGRQDGETAADAVVDGRGAARRARPPRVEPRLGVTTRVSRTLSRLGHERRRRAAAPPRAYPHLRLDVPPSWRPGAPALTSRAAASAETFPQTHWSGRVAFRGL